MLTFAAGFSRRHDHVADTADRRFFRAWSLSQAWVMALETADVVILCLASCDKGVFFYKFLSAFTLLGAAKGIQPVKILL